MTRALRSRAPAIIVAVVVLGALTALVITIAGEDPAQTSVGIATRVEPHEICIRSAEARSTCAHVDAPAAVSGVEVGDCVRIKRAADGILESVESADRC